MLPSSHRLPLGKPRPGIKIDTPLARLIIRPKPYPPSRVGIIVSKKTALLATKRNLIKRRFANAIKPLLNTPPAFDVVIITKPAASQATFEKISAVLTSHFPVINK